MSARVFGGLHHIVFALALFTNLGCQTPSSNAESGNAEMVRQVAEGVGMVKLAEGSASPIFVLEEYHTSRVGQLQEAVMLVRLHDKHGLRRIGLEGAIRTHRPLDASWFHGAGGAAAEEARHDVAVRTLAEGEISAAEFMALLFPDVEVWGIESSKEYFRELDVKGNPSMVYLLAISEKLLTLAQMNEVMQLINDEKQKEALEYMLEADPWVRSMVEALKSDSASSVEELASQIRQIQAKAEAVEAVVPSEAAEGLKSTLEFFETASHRSKTMADATLKIPRQAPVAMIVGAAHTDKITKIFREKLVSFAVVSPVALHPDYGNLSIEQFERKNDGLPVRTSKGSLGAVLSRKPSPVIEKPWAKSYANMHLACLLLADAARKDEPVGDSVWAELSALPGVRIDRQSFEQIEHDVIFRAWLTDVRGEQQEVWARVGSAENVEQSKKIEGELHQRIEGKLQQAIVDLGGSNNLPPTKPPSGSDSTADNEGPGDGKRGGTILNRLSKTTVAVYAGSKAKVIETGKVSG